MRAIIVMAFPARLAWGVVGARADEAAEPWANFVVLRRQPSRTMSTHP